MIEANNMKYFCCYWYHYSITYAYLQWHCKQAW